MDIGPRMSEDTMTADKFVNNGVGRPLTTIYFLITFSNKTLSI